MSSGSSTSLLMVLSLYTSLRRSGSSEQQAQAKVRDVASKLSAADHQALVNSVTEWEAQHAAQLVAAADATFSQRKGMVITPEAASIYGTSEYDLQSSAGLTALQPVHRLRACPRCGRQTEAAQQTCPSCGITLAAVEVASSSDPRAATWFGPASMLVLTFAGSAKSVELAVREAVRLGRHTPEDFRADLDLTAYGADVYGVSRLHASLERREDRLTLTDLGSTYHTFVNGQQLQVGEVCTLQSGDLVLLGALSVTVSFKHAP